MNTKDPVKRYGELVDELGHIAESYQRMAQESAELIQSLRPVVATHRLSTREKEAPVLIEHTQEQSYDQTDDPMVNR